MTKIKNNIELKLRKYLRKILGLSFVDTRLQILEHENIKRCNEFSAIQKDVDLLKSLCDIAVDVHEKTDSWAVVCISGKHEYVKFVKLESRDARDVMNFLHRFEKSNSRLIDAPYPFLDTFKW